MKLLIVLMLCMAAIAAPNQSNKIQLDEEFQKEVQALDPSQPESRNILVNLLLRQLFNIIRGVINNGFPLLGIPPLDPLDLESLHLKIPAGLFNLDLQMTDAHLSGIGDFILHTSSSNMREFSVTLDISVPRIDIRAGGYDLIGDLLTAVPLYGNGDASFEVENFRFRALVFLQQSEDEKSIIINRVENASFDLPHFKSAITGAIGGGDIDAIANAIVEEVIVGYVHRFHGAISLIVGNAAVTVLNPILERIDSWRFIAPFV